MRLNEKIRILRKRKRLTQKDLAEHIGVSHRTITRIEGGTWGGNLETLNAIASFFGVDIRWIISDSDDVPNYDMPEEKVKRHTTVYEPFPGMVERSDEGATTAEMKGWIMEAIGSIDSMDALSDIYDYVMFKHSQIFRDEKKSNKSASME